MGGDESDPRGMNGRGELNLGLEKGCARDQQDINSLSLSMGEGVFTDRGRNNVSDSEWAAEGGVRLTERRA